MYNCEILLRIDNVTAISCINRMGSIKYKHFNSISREIWDWCERRKITVFASYINTIDNYEADYLSRKSLPTLNGSCAILHIKKFTNISAKQMSTYLLVAQMQSVPYMSRGRTTLTLGSLMHLQYRGQKCFFTPFHHSR